MLDGVGWQLVTDVSVQPVDREGNQLPTYAAYSWCGKIEKFEFNNTYLLNGVVPFSLLGTLYTDCATDCEMQQLKFD
jgi:hypothetical protein